MKVFFTLLLLVNIVFALFQWLVPYEQLIKAAPPVAVAEELRLLDEPNERSAEKLDTPAETEAVAQPLDNLSGPLCYTLGPFKEQQLAQQAASQFRQNNIEITSRSSVEKEYMGMMVYIDGHQSRDQAVQTADSLKSKGVRDYIIVNEPGKTNILSLGVFSLKKNAERRKQRIADLGYQVDTEPRYRNRRIYWLDYSEPENDGLGELVGRLKKDLGISRISRQCNA